jgi:glycosyltransferase involved in cell wall biosynthesis
MRIGIDAKWYFNGPPSGVRVIQNLINSLLDFDHENEYFIFLSVKSKGMVVPFKRKGVTIVYVWAGNNLLSNVIALPLKANRLHLDVMLCQNFVSPFQKGKTFVYIFDVLFKTYPQFFTKPERLYFFCIKYLAWFADGLITISETEKNRLAEYRYARKENIHAIHIGVDKSFKILEKHTPSEVNEVKLKYKLPENFLLYVGRLNARKNIENLLGALPLVKNKTIPLVIVGKEDWKQFNYDKLLSSNGIKDRIHFTGWTDDVDLPIIYSLATIFCFPSYAEGFGLPPLEAMASGVPVIVSNTTSLPEVCGDAAIYIDPEKPQQTALAIDQLLENDDLAQNKIQAGLNQASTYTWEKTALAIYKVLTNSNR